MRSKVTVAARAPSNIAIVKYMGKRDESLNLPENGSISLTLSDRCTLAEITRTPRGIGSVGWEGDAVPHSVSRVSPVSNSFFVPQLGEKDVERICDHVKRVARLIPGVFAKFGLECIPELERGWDFALRSANTFPHSSGIASSASSFAATTLAAAMACAADVRSFERAYRSEPELRNELAEISRLGSGSSCRSFTGPWVAWEGEKAKLLNSNLPQLSHFVLVLSSEKKRVSSSEAHARVKTSPLWEGRVLRATQRASQLREALEAGDFSRVARIAWKEAWEMHGLFHTCEEPFTYWAPATVEVLQALTPALSEPFPPIVTLDAGPNIHLIVKDADREGWRARLRKLLPQNSILEDHQGLGAAPVSEFFQSWE